MAYPGTFCQNMGLKFRAAAPLNKLNGAPHNDVEREAAPKAGITKFPWLQDPMHSNVRKPTPLPC